MEKFVSKVCRYSLKNWSRLSKIVALCFLLASPMAYGQTENTFETPERLFHIARSANKNLVCYDVQLVDGKLNTEKPLHVYWVNREERMGETNELNFFQRKMAYGYKLVSKEADSSEVTLTAYPGRKLTIQKLDDHYVCTLLIQNQKAILQSLYVQASPKNPLSVEYIELHGVAVQDGSALSEKIYKE